MLHPGVRYFFQILEIYLLIFFTLTRGEQLPSSVAIPLYRKYKSTVYSCYGSVIKATGAFLLVNYTCGTVVKAVLVEERN